MLSALKAKFNLQRFFIGEGARRSPYLLTQRRVYILPTKQGLAFAFLLFTCSCTGPSMMGFPHSNMHPAGGTEFAVVPHAGGAGGNGFGVADAGGVLSVAHDFGKVGLSAAAGAYYLSHSTSLHAHVELASALGDTRNDLIFGLGYADNFDIVSFFK